MRIAPLLTAFLYQKKYLDIPGIGKFSIEGSLEVPDPNDKNFEAFLQNIRFEQKPITQVDEALVDFIRAQTGKIRPLALADLDSLLADYKGFLNLGKPLYLEGIGNLNKLRSGKIEFTPGAPAAEQIDLYNDEALKPGSKEKKDTERTNKVKIDFDITQYKKTLIVAAGVLAFLLVLTGGYYLYEQMDAAPEKNEAPVSTPKLQPAPPPAPIVDSNSLNNTDSSLAKKDSSKPEVTPTAPAPEPVAKPAPVPAPAPTVTTTLPAASNVKKGFKFVLQKTTNKERAIENFNAVRMKRSDIQLETKDSITFKIFVVQPCQPSDTARIKESLNLWYWGKREPKVFIEN